MSYLAVISLGIFTQAARSQGTLLNNQVKSTTIEHCPLWNSTLNSTVETSAQHDIIEKSVRIKSLLLFLKNIFLISYREGAVFILLEISYLWYPMIGTFIVIIVGTLVSLLTGRQNPDQLDPKLCYNFLRRWIGKKRTTNMVAITLNILV